MSCSLVPLFPFPLSTILFSISFISSSPSPIISSKHLLSLTVSADHFFPYFHLLQFLSLLTNSSTNFNSQPQIHTSIERDADHNH
ncbi:hypothetical protein L6452_21089 [Arctium lappa]|uniref:Uncharacterized protein n=1 Tax=Arctium lappa TaxID=4217 RepID=A0ACB9BEG7_ARCLA|nr:hypothetical protein L6452_21089 [Arctium lappa]